MKLNKFIIKILLIVVPYSAVYAQEGRASKLCLKESTGRISIRTECGENEKVVNLDRLVQALKSDNALKGPKGDKGSKGDKGKQGDPGSLKVKECYSKLGSDNINTVLGKRSVSVQCNNTANEFMLERSFSANTDKAALVEDIAQLDSDEVPVGASVTTYSSQVSFYQLVVRILCCPR